MRPKEFLYRVGWVLWLAVIFVQIYVGGMILKLTWVAYTGTQGYGQWIACGHWNVYGEGFTELILVFINIIVATAMAAYWAYKFKRTWLRREKQTSLRE